MRRKKNVRVNVFEGKIIRTKFTRNDGNESEEWSRSARGAIETKAKSLCVFNPSKMTLD